jgi:hypothetical protein
MNDKLSQLPVKEIDTITFSRCGDFDRGYSVSVEKNDVLPALINTYL